MVTVKEEKSGPQIISRNWILSKNHLKQSTYLLIVNSVIFYNYIIINEIPYITVHSLYNDERL